MSTKITINPFSRASVYHAMQKLEAYKRQVEKKSNVLCERLAELGAKRVSIEYSKVEHLVTTNPMPTIEVQNDGDVWKILADGEEAVFIEFGAGAMYGYGHPDPQGFGPGTYNPNSDNWKTGWYYNKQFTYGNTATAGMWKAKEDIKDNLKRIAEEVFNG